MQNSKTYFEKNKTNLVLNTIEDLFYYYFLFCYSALFVFRKLLGIRRLLFESL